MSNTNSWALTEQSTGASTVSAKLFFMGLSFSIGLVTFIVYLFVWYLCTRNRRRIVGNTAPLPLTDTHGLSKSAIARLPTFVYPNGEKDSTGNGADCAICLGQLQGGEKVRNLPRCKHLFHVDCIDMWLFSHSTCPICRCDVRAVGAAKKAEANRASAPVPVPPLPPV